MATERGFTLTELLVTSTLMLLVAGTAITTFRNGLALNDSAAQLADANQNLRAGTNTLIRDIMMAVRVIGPAGISMPTGAGTAAFRRPGPPGTTLVFSTTSDPNDPTPNLPVITTGYGLGPTINGSATDMITILTIDEFMPVLQSIPTGSPTGLQGVVAADGSSITLPTNSPWLVGDTVNDTPPINVGDLVYFKNVNDNAIQMVTKKDSTHIYFENNANDWFKFNQQSAPNVPIRTMDPVNVQTAMFRALMITYYVDNTTTPGTPRLTRLVDNFTPQALAGVVEDIDLTYDLVDGSTNPTNQTSLPVTINSVTYNSSQIRKVNVHVGVRSELLSKPAQDYIRNHISTAVDVRSLASIDRYSVQ